jgi:hypothetical protein
MKTLREITKQTLHPTLHPIDCCLLVSIRRKAIVSTRQFPLVACELGTSITRIERSLNSLVKAKLVKVLPKPTAQNQSQGAMPRSA